jgi:hypothetical protein
MTGRALLVALVIAAPGVAAAAPARFAIVIGNNQPDSPRLPLLRYADDDAVAIGRLLGEAGVEVAILVRLDAASRRMHPELVAGAPTWGNLSAGLARLNRRIDEERRAGRATELLFYYSGHGSVAGGEGYVVLEDARLTRSVLHDQVLRRSRAARNHVIVDACKSYFLAFGKGAGGRRRTFGRSFAVGALPGDLANTGFVLSTSSDRDSHEWERFQSGVFSYQVRSALRGAADADLDGGVSYAELGAFLTAANRAIPNERFRPDFAVRPPGGARHLGVQVLSWPFAARSLVIDRPSGRLYVESARGERLLDVHPAERQRLALVLPAERPQFVRTADGATEYLLAGAGAVRLSALRAQAASTASKGALNLAFEDLFAAPFGDRDVRAYQRGYRDDFIAVAAAAEPVPTRVRVRQIAGWTAIGAAGLGLAATGWALERRRAADDASQVDRPRLNDQIHRLNVASWVLYGVAGAAAGTWLAARYWPESDDDSLLVVPTGEGDGAALMWGGSW